MENHGSRGNHNPLSDFEISIASDVAIWRQAEWGDMRVGYETYLSDFDDTELPKDFLMASVHAHTGDTFWQDA